MNIIAFCTFPNPAVALVSGGAVLFSDSCESDYSTNDIAVASFLHRAVNEAKTLGLFGDASFLTFHGPSPFSSIRINISLLFGVYVGAKDYLENGSAAAYSLSLFDALALKIFSSRIEEGIIIAISSSKESFFVMKIEKSGDRIIFRATAEELAKYEGCGYNVQVVSKGVLPVIGDISMRSLFLSCAGYIGSCGRGAFRSIPFRCACDEMVCSGFCDAGCCGRVSVCKWC
ncbi:hypothetical protein [Candidatus Hydrogenosomobacter endosymbioticus]|uniref:Uncharacterized protein n=1 Tax=Candidatus Hydrogenosomobacter endosymbioticus TaxID=2558174 RepID=A0ABM7V822_9PROT|nr:hypothetical protein [Candidatus Hydrogenosomobacter endosymbioticus]BDB95907.1 hypothetical protein HYD_0400 [Candidatus Hydrogenosomobacter endosymbioticus]